jgi:transposase
LFPGGADEPEKSQEKGVDENTVMVKEVWVPHKDAGTRARRYVVCFNPAELKRQRAHREEVLSHLEAELASLEHSRDDHPRRACDLLSSKRYGKYLHQDSRGRLSIDKKKIRQEERLDGKFVVYSNDGTLNASDLALGYKQLIRVEQGWRDLKSGLKIGPVRHWLPFRIKAHVTLCVMALLLQRVAENMCDDTWRNIRDGLRQIKVTEYKSPHGHFVQTNTMKPTPEALLKALKIPKPDLLLSVK